MNIARINATACKCGTKYIYLFGGLDIQKNEFTDNIERFNQELSIWTILTLKLPNKISNCFAFSLNPEMILIMGGVIKKDNIGFGGSGGSTAAKEPKGPPGLNGGLITPSGGNFNLH